MTLFTHRAHMLIGAALAILPMSGCQLNLSGDYGRDCSAAADAGCADGLICSGPVGQCTFACGEDGGSSCPDGDVCQDGACVESTETDEG